MPTLKIRVGVAIDANVGAAFQPILTASRKARAQVESDMGGAAKKTQSVYRQNASEAARAADKAATEAERAAQREVRAKEKALAYVARLRDRHFRDQQRQEEKAAADASRSAAKRAEQTGYWSVRYAGRAVGAAGRFGMDMARGAGVNLNMGAIIGKAVSMEKRAVDLANASIGTGVKGNETRAGTGGLLTQARDVGISAGYDPERVLEGLQKFVAKTGDLKTGRDMLADLARLSSATGSELEDMVDAAGDVANALGEVPNKGKVVESVMRSIAGQGKVGAVEMKDLAVQMAKLGAAAGAFEGDADKNIEMMGIFAQMSRARGGSASATQAATSVGSMVNILKTPARIKAFKEAGLKQEDLFNEKGLLRNPFEIMKKALVAAGNDPTALKKMYANTGGARAVEGFATIYRQAGGGQKGIAAVDAEYERLRKATITKAAVEEAHAERMKTNAAKIEVFNAKLTEIGAKVAEKVLPQMEKLGPIVLDAVDGMGKLVAWVAANPLKSAFVLLGASIARAGAETVIRAGIESMVKSAAAGGTGGMMGKGLGALGSGLTIAALAVTTVMVGTMIIDEMSKDTANIQTDAIEDGLRKEDVNQTLKAAREGREIDAAAVERAKQRQQELSMRMTAAKETTGAETAGDVAAMLGGGILGSVIGGYIEAALGGASVGNQAQRDADRNGATKGGGSGMDALAAEMAAIKGALSGTLKVHVDNQTSGAPGVDPTTRTGPPG